MYLGCLLQHKWIDTETSINVIYPTRGHLSGSPHTNNQYESQIFATNFCLLTLLVNIGKVKVLN